MYVYLYIGNQWPVLYLNNYYVLSGFAYIFYNEQLQEINNK